MFAQHTTAVLTTFLFCTVGLGQSFAGNELDKFGGLKSKHFDIKNNGYFRTHFEDGQWWLVTPENKAFLSFGLNHFHAGLWRQKYNKAYWEKEFGGAMGSPQWKDGFHNHAREVVKATTVNTMAYHNEERILLERKPLLPYIRQYIPVKFSMHMNAKPKDYVDVFAPQFEKICDRAAKEQVTPYVNDLMVIGFAMADIPVLTERWAQAVKGRGIPRYSMRCPGSRRTYTGLVTSA